MARNNLQYLNLEHPKVIRRGVLQTAIDSTYSLIHFEDYKLIRSKKITQIKKIKTIIRKIKRELNSLNKILSPLEEKIITDKKEFVKKPKKRSVTKRVNTLDEEIKDIKSKLKKIGI